MLLFVVAGCGSIPIGFDRVACPLRPVDLDRLVRGRILHARLDVQLRDHAALLDVVAEASADRLLVAGLAPHQGRLFVVTQTGRDVQVEAGSTGTRLLAHAVFDALHRAYWAGPRPGAATGASEWHGERVVDESHASEIVRSFVSEGRREPVAVVDYRPREGTGGLPPDVTVSHAACRYDAMVTILEGERDAPREVTERSNGQVGIQQLSDHRLVHAERAGR